MAKQNINVGTTANDKKGDSLRAAFVKVNANFTELYKAVGLADTGQDTALTFVGSTIGTDDSSSIVIDRATTITSNLNVGGDILPQTANGGDLGSSTLPWRSLYVSNNTIYIGGTAVGVDANGNLTVNGGQVNTPSSTLVNGANTVSLGSDGVLTLPGGIQVAGILKIDNGVHEKLQTNADATGTVTHDCSLGHIFYHTSPDANWTANFLNLNLSSGYATSVTLVIEQGATGYYPSAFRIDYMVHAIKWQGNTTPTPSTNRTDVVTFSIICTATDTYTVLGQLTGF